MGACGGVFQTRPSSQPATGPSSPFTPSAIEPNTCSGIAQSLP